MFDALRFLACICAALFMMSDPAAADHADDFPQGRQFVVGFAQDTMANDWRMAQVHELQKGLAGYPFIKFIYTDAGGDAAQQVLDVEELVTGGVDVLVASPASAVAADRTISQAYQAGIPVVLLDRGIKSDSYTTYITADNREIARSAAQYLAGALDGDARILMLEGVPAASATVERTKGFLSEMEKFPGMKLVSTKTANFLRSDAALATEEAIDEGVSFNAIYAQSDSMASGVRMALEMRGVSLSDIQIVGIDYITEARDAIIAKTQNASFTYPTFGKEGAEVVVEILRGHAVPKAIIVDSQMVTLDNVKEVQPIF